MAKLRVSLTITEDELLKWYRQDAQDVYAIAHDGSSVRFPANILQPYVSHSGVQGTFEIEFDEYGKFRSIARLA